MKRFLSDVQGGVVPQTLWKHEVVGHTQEAKRDLKSLIEFETSEEVFETPKPSRLIKQMLRIATAPNESDLVLDFFAGSGTTAQAVMELNKEDGGNRRFMVMQIAEPLESRDYPSIGHITRERIRRAGDRVLAEWKERHTDRLPLGEAAPTPPDVGFRVFRLDSSNWKPWDDSFVSPDQPDLFIERLKAHLDNAKPDRRDIDVVYEVFLKYGVPLTEKLSTMEIEGKRFYVVGESGFMFICLDKGMTVEVVEAAAKYTPGTMIFADECFADNTELTNAALSLEKAGVEFRWI